MSVEEFIKWIDQEIAFSKDLQKQFPPQSRGHDRASDGIAIFTIVKEKFLTLTPAPTTLS
jgi:hypothetical protein